MENVFHHKQSYIIIDIDENVNNFLLDNKNKYKTINIILNDIGDEIYGNISAFLEKTDKKIVLTSLSVLTNKLAKRLCEKYPKTYLNRNDKLVLTNGSKDVIFEDTFFGVKMTEIKPNGKTEKIFRRKPIMKN